MKTIKGPGPLGPTCTPAIGAYDCLQKYVNKLMKIQNEPRSHLQRVL